MNNIDPLLLRRLDLNSLVVLHTLLTTRSVSRSADKLCLGQPAVSHILKHLRQQLADELLCRYGRSMVLTPLAESLLQPLGQWLQQGQQLLQVHAFDVRSIRQTVRLAMPDLLEAALLPALIIALQKEAPGLTLEVQAMASRQVEAALTDGQIDCAIGYFPRLQGHACRQIILDSRFICLYHPDQLTLPAMLSASAVAQAPHIFTSYTGESAGLIDDYLRRHGQQRRILASTASLLAIPGILEQVAAVSVLPEVIGPIVQRHSPGLHWQPITDAALTIPIELLWHPRFNTDPLQQFLRQLIISQAALLQEAITSFIAGPSGPATAHFPHRAGRR